MKIAHYDESQAINGLAPIIGFYDSKIHQQIPVPNIELSDEQWQECIDNNGRRRVEINTKAIAAYTPPPPALADYQATVYNQVRADLYAFITDEGQSDFPEWKQANYSSRLAELADKVANGDALSTAEADERTAIHAVIAWKNGLLAERDRVKAEIDAAADNAAVDTAAASMQLTAPPFKL